MLVLTRRANAMEGGEYTYGSASYVRADLTWAPSDDAVLLNR